MCSRDDVDYQSLVMKSRLDDIESKLDGRLTKLEAKLECFDKKINAVRECCEKNLSVMETLLARMSTEEKKP